MDKLIAKYGNPIRKLWDMLAPLPGGNYLFSKAVGKLAPYTGTMGAVVEELRPGYARVRLDDRRAVRNHLNSIHAIALMNLAELSSGIGMTYSLPDNMRGIITHLEIDYLKKARGRLTAECHPPEVQPGVDADSELRVDIRDAAGEVVARARAKWRVGPIKRHN